MKTLDKIFVVGQAGIDGLQGDHALARNMPGQKYRAHAPRTDFLN